MERLERLVPGAADRILAMAEKDQEAACNAQRLAHERESAAERNAHTERMAALWMAFTICLSFAGCGVFLIMRGYEKTGVAFVGITLVGVVSSFLFRKKQTP